MKPSTKEFWREARKAENFSLGKWLHGYIYGKYIYTYIAIGTGEHFICRFLAPLAALIKKVFHSGKESGGGWADSYHGKVIQPNSARQLVNVNQKVEIRDLEKIVPFNSARDIILNNPEHIVALECPCRASRKNPCLPLDVCLVIGDPFAGFILEHHPRKSRRISVTEAEQILQEAHARNNVHHAFFKEEMLDRFYAICNCCSCCCGAINAMKNGTPMLAPSGYTVTRNDDCVHCGRCVESCQFDALEMIDKKLVINDKCMGCGVCVSHCKKNALSLERDAANGEPLEIKALIKEFDTEFR